MKPIKFIESDGTQLLFNPSHVTDVKAVYSEYSQNWCLVININRGNGTSYTHTRIYDNKEECKSATEYVENCMTD